MAGEWTEAPFPDVIDFQEGPGILAKDFSDEGIPLVRLSGLDRGGSVLAGCNYLDPEMVAKKWSHFALAKGDILLSTSASLGRIAVVGDDGVGAIPYTGIIRMRPRDDRLFAPFIRYLLEGPEFQQQAEMVGVGSVIKHFGPMHLRQMSVRIPPVAEQRAVAHILGTLDDKIELNRRMSETLEAMARALFKSWFVDFDPVRAKAEGRLPAGRQATPPRRKPGTWFVYAIECDDESIYIGHTDDVEHRFEEHLKGKGAEWTKRHRPKRVVYWEELPSRAGAIAREKKLKTGSGREWLKTEMTRRDLERGGLPQPLADLFPPRFVDSELGRIPEGWKIGLLGSVLAQRVDRCTPSDETRSRPYVPIDCIAARSLLLAESKPGEEAQSSLTKFSKGDLLFGAMRPYFHKVAIAPFDGTTRTTVFVLRPLEADEFAFAVLLLHDPNTIEFATNHSTGSTIPYAVWQGSLDAMPIVLPPRIVRTSFDRLARPLLDRIPPLFFANRTVAALRDTLLPKLISGELRIEDAERFVGRAV